MDIFEYCHSEIYWCEVDKWIPLVGENIFTNVKNAIILPVSSFFGMTKSNVLDTFFLLPKRCYNSDEIRNHICKYLNYFEKFYDHEHELLFYMYKIKASIDMGVYDNAVDNGVITAVGGNGTAIVTATCGEQPATCNVVFNITKD